LNGWVFFNWAVQKHFVKWVGLRSQFVRHYRSDLRKPEAGPVTMWKLVETKYVSLTKLNVSDPASIQARLEPEEHCRSQSESVNGLVIQISTLHCFKERKPYYAESATRIHDAKSGTK
jgi:hypothetical protein